MIQFKDVKSKSENGRTKSITVKQVVQLDLGDTLDCHIEIVQLYYRHFLEVFSR